MTRTAKLKLFANLTRSQALVAAAFVVVFGALGAYLVFFSHAASPGPGHAITSGYSGKCVDDKNNASKASNPVDITSCNGGASQNWHTVWAGSSGQILLRSNLCITLAGSSVKAGTPITVYTCGGSNHQQWVQRANGELYNVGSGLCLTAPSNTNGTQLVVNGCIPSLPQSQHWNGGPTPPPNPSIHITSPGSGAKVSGSAVTVAAQASVASGGISSLSIATNGTTLKTCAAASCSASWNTTKLKNGTYTIKASASGSEGGASSATESVTVSNAAPPSKSPGGGGSGGGGGGSGSGGGSSSGSGSSGSGGSNLQIAPSGGGGSTGTLNLTSPSNESGTTPSITVPEQPTAPMNGPPTVSDVVATNITTNSITISWQASGTTGFTIKYGTDKQKLNATHKMQSDEAVPSYRIANLPAGKTIYISITPENDGTTGQVARASFKTVSPSSPLGMIITLFVLAVVAAFVILLVRARLKRAAQTTTDIDMSSLPLYPEEDQATREARLNWWLPEDQQQPTAAQQEPKPDDIPDMFAEGRQRLEQEQYPAPTPAAQSAPPNEPPPPLQYPQPQPAPTHIEPHHTEPHSEPHHKSQTDTKQSEDNDASQGEGEEHELRLR